MKMYDKRNVIQLLKGASRYKELGIYSFKKDRKIIITIDDGPRYAVHEDGFTVDDFQLTDNKELSKFIKKLLTKEFPHSHKLYITMKK